MTSTLLLLALLADGLVGQGTAPTTSEPAPGAVVVPSTITPPSLIAEGEVVYPADAWRDDVAGAVVMDVEVGADGVIRHIAVTSSPDPRLSWAALGALTNFELQPAIEVFADGRHRAVPVRFEHTLTFTIDEVVRERVIAEEEALALSAQRATAPINLVGRVKIKAEPGTVAAAVVSIEGTDFEAVTDDDGAFEFRGVDAGDVVLVIDAAGFDEGRVAINDKKAGEVDEVVVYLGRRTQSGGEYVVSERRTQREVTRRVLTRHELTRVPGTFGDAIRVVQRLPGVSRAPFGLGAVLVRGGSPEDSSIMIDGHLTRYLFHLGAGPSVLNSDFVERLEFYPGGQGARYGRAIAGAIDVVTKDPASDVWSGRANVDLLSTSFRLEGPLTADGKLSLFAAGRTSYIAEVLNAGDVITRIVADDRINLLTLAPRYADYQAKLLWKLPSLPGLSQALTFTVLGANDTLDLALDASQLGPAAPSNIGLEQGFHRFNPVYKARSATRNDVGEPVLSVWISPTVERNTSVNRFDASQFKLDVDRAGVRAEVALRPVGGIGVTLGTDDVWQHFTSVVDLPSLLPDERLFPRPVVSDPPRFQGSDEVWSTSSAIFVDSDVSIGPVTFLVGARAEYTTYYDQVRTTLDPRFAVRANVLPFTTLKANVGQYHQTPSPFFLAKQAGNPDLPLERGWQTGLGIETWLTRSLDVDAQFFYRTADDLAEPVGGPTAFVATGAPRIQPIGHERAYGAELLIRQRLDKGFFGWISYTLMRGEERQDATVAVEGDAAKARGWRSTEFDQTHNFSIASSMQLPAGFEVGLAVRYVTGNPTTFVQAAVFDADDGRYKRVNGPSRSERLPAFFQVDARVDKRFVFDTWALGLYCDLQNATNQQNYELFQYGYDYRVVQGFPGLPIIPVFGAEASF